MADKTVTMPDTLTVPQKVGSTPNYQDAQIMLQCATLIVQLHLTEKLGWVFSDDFETEAEPFRVRHPRGSAKDNDLSAVFGFFETVGTLYKNGLFNGHLLFDWLAIDMVWQRVKDIALLVREETGNDAVYENFELIADVQRVL